MDQDLEGLKGKKFDLCRSEARAAALAVREVEFHLKAAQDAWARLRAETRADALQRIGVLQPDRVKVRFEVRPMRTFQLTFGDLSALEIVDVIPVPKKAPEAPAPTVEEPEVAKPEPQAEAAEEKPPLKLPGKSRAKKRR